MMATRRRIAGIREESSPPRRSAQPRDRRRDRPTPAADTRGGEGTSALTEVTARTAARVRRRFTEPAELTRTCLHANAQSRIEPLVHDLTLELLRHKLDDPRAQSARIRILRQPHP